MALVPCRRMPDQETFSEFATHDLITWNGTWSLSVESASAALTDDSTTDPAEYRSDQRKLIQGFRE